VNFKADCEAKYGSDLYNAIMVRYNEEIGPLLVWQGPYNVAHAPLTFQFFSPISANDKLDSHH
jgi:hypothetical protein